MPEDTPATPLPDPASEEASHPASQPSLDLGPGPGVNIGEEFGTAKRNLPPAKIVAIALAAAAIILGTLAFLQRAKPQGGGSVDHIAATEIPDQNAVLVAVNVTVRNAGQRPLWIHTIKATLETGGHEYSDDAASAIDFDRYFQAFPVLKERAIAALPPETKIPPGGEAKGTVVVSFPVTQEGFDKRQSLSVVIQPYDQPVPLILK
jgi:hypothetical protein